MCSKKGSVSSLQSWKLHVSVRRSNYVCARVQRTSKIIYLRISFHSELRKSRIHSMKTRFLIVIILYIKIHQIIPGIIHFMFIWRRNYNFGNNSDEITLPVTLYPRVTFLSNCIDTLHWFIKETGQLFVYFLNYVFIYIL